MKRYVLTGILLLIGTLALVSNLGGASLPGWVPSIKTVTASKGAGDGGGASRSPQVAPVEVAAARQVQATNDIRALGSLQSDETVRIAPEIAGRVQEVVFAEGQPVKQGDVIVKIDDALVQAELSQARARLTLAKANNDRARTLSRSGSVTERTSDEAQANFETATAEVELARTRLEKHTLRAPFDGVAGVRAVSVGAYVTVGAPIVNIEKIDQLKVDFKVPELFLSAIAVDQEIFIDVDALPGRRFKGVIYAIDPAIDVNGRALSIRARLRNEDGALRPGLFARIVIRGLVKRDVVMIPESAILPRGGETFIFRIENGKAVETRVKIGDRRDGEVEIVEGLKGDATVVTAGQQRLRDGSPVEIVSTGQPQQARPQQRPAGSGGSSNSGRS